MVRVLGMVDGRQVIERDFFIFKTDQIIEIIPFSDDSDYKILFNVEIVERSGSKTIRSAEGESTYKITHQRDWFDGKTSAYLGSSSFASDEDYRYFLSFSVMPIGIQSRFAFQMNYIISREAQK
ncbi:hypothetical protein MKK67_24415 [Methylobacterium sp. J-072]|uniref:hypothetical protein n=1 Tax=Methylobacterium sp. J-072 TaxID=2836651 RepID=UPI001FB92183|nr:hypothetical protein [Methylobacterium sp. J-072]MCJ2095617.1 hypothetical protein [Methylobacterium sp. J-072]